MISFRKSVFVLLGGQASRVLVQAVYFVLLARILGVTSYGAFTAAVAVAALVSPFSALGTNILMVKNVARSSETATANFFRAVFYTLLGGIALSVILASLGHYIVPHTVSFWAIAAIAAADLIGLKLIELAGYMWQALGSSKPLAILPTLMNVFRLLAVLAMDLLYEQVTVGVWAVAYLLATLPLGIVVVAMTMRRQGRLSKNYKISTSELKEGFLFSVGLASQNSYNDLDKAMLAKLVSATSAGVYSAAYRVVDMAYTPVRSIAAAAYPLFFKEGEGGIRSALRLTRKITPMVLPIAVFGALAIWVLAPYAPMVLGAEFEEAIGIIRMLAPLILIRSLSFLAADTLMGSGFQGFRSMSQIAVAVINVGLNIILIPEFGIPGAVVSSLLCESVLAALLWGRIGIALKVESKSTVA